MDLTGNAYGPSLRVYEALSDEQAIRQPLNQMNRSLVERIAEIERVPTDWILVGSGIEDLLVLLLRAYGRPDNLVLFPPTNLSTSNLADKMGFAPTLLPRSSRFTLDLDREGLPAFPPNALSIIQNPNDPTGTPVTVQEAVRLIRRSQLLVVDERHIGYGARSLMPLVREFDRIAILRTFETWAGLNALPVAYAVASPATIERIRTMQLVPVAAALLMAAHATLDDLRTVESTVIRVRDEKARLFRMLRKLNMLQPLPSWSNFILTQVERGDSSTIRSELLVRGIIVDVPLQDGLESTLRITATNHEATAALRASLIEIAPLLGSPFQNQSTPNHFRSGNSRLTSHDFLRTTSNLQPISCCLRYKKLRRIQKVGVVGLNSRRRIIPPFQRPNQQMQVVDSVVRLLPPEIGLRRPPILLEKRSHRRPHGRCRRPPACPCLWYHDWTGRGRRIGHRRRGRLRGRDLRRIQCPGLGTDGRDDRRPCPHRAPGRPCIGLRD